MPPRTARVERLLERTSSCATINRGLKQHTVRGFPTYQVFGQCPRKGVCEGYHVESYCTASVESPSQMRPTQERATLALTFVEERDRPLQFPRRIRPGDVQVVEHLSLSL